MCKNSVERVRPQMTIWRMHIAFSITNATNIHTQVMQYSSLFYCNNGCTTAPHCYVIRALPVLETIILYLVLIGYESWSFTPREGYKAGVSENRALCRISGRKRRKSQEKGETLYTEDLHDLWSFPNINRLKKSIKKGLERCVARTKERRNA